MLSEKEKNFILHWESVREKESNFKNKLSGGLPMAMIFGLPIILSVVVVYIFFPDWYMKISNTTPGTFIMVIVAVLIAIFFYSYFRMHFKWEMNEQLYMELKNRQQEDASKHEMLS